MLERGELAGISVRIVGKSSWEGTLQRRMGEMNCSHEHE